MDARGAVTRNNQTVWGMCRCEVTSYNQNRLPKGTQETYLLGYRDNNKIKSRFHWGSASASFVDRTLFLPSKPLDNAALMEFAQALQTRQLLPDLILLHADGAFLRHTIMADTVFLRGGEREHSHRVWRLRRRTATMW